MITEHQQVAQGGATSDAADAIAQAVQLYIDGTARGDGAKLAEAFHPDARIYGAVGAQRFDVPVAEFAKLITESPADAAGTYRARITSIVETGDAAIATVVEEGFWGTMSFTDFLSLCRIEDRWRIVNKTSPTRAASPRRRREPSAADRISTQPGVRMTQQMEVVVMGAGHARPAATHELGEAPPGIFSRRSAMGRPAKRSPNSGSGFEFAVKPLVHRGGERPHQRDPF